MKSLIGRIEDAINNKYSPKKYGDVDWEKAILSPYMIAGLDTTFESCLQHNASSFRTMDNAVSSLKMDEIATESRVRWNKQDMEFSDVKSISNLHNLIANETIHKTKENLVVAIGNIGDGGQVTPLLSLPSCSKDEIDQFPAMINAVCNFTNVDVIATDGDGTRRLFSAMLEPIKDNTMQFTMKKMPLFDLNFVNATIVIL